MTEDEAIALGMPPRGEESLALIRRELSRQIELESESQGAGDMVLAKCLCVQLFLNGDVADLPLIWRTRGASFDAGCSIDLHLMIGPGFDAAQLYLRESADPDANVAADEIQDNSSELRALDLEVLREEYRQYYLS